MAKKKKRKLTYDSAIQQMAPLEIENFVVDGETPQVVSVEPRAGGNAMAKANKFLTEELYDMTIGEILVTDLESGMEMFSGSLKSTNVNKTATKTAVRAGRDNTQWLEIVGDSEITVEVTDIQAKRDWLALKLGGTLTNGTVELEAFPKNYKVGGGAASAKEIELEQTPLAGTTPVVYNKKTGATIEATLSGKKLTITSGAEIGDVVLVGSYKYSATADKVDIPASSSGRDVSITITRPQANRAQKVVCEKVWKFYRASFSTDFVDEATAEKSESAISTSFTILKHEDHDTLGFLAYVPVNQ